MLDILSRAIEQLLAENWINPEDHESWNSLDIDYEPPRVERLWRPFEDCRLYLHKIHPCETALLHPHPWPSAVKIIHGSYEMVIADGIRASKGSVAKFVLEQGSSYEMVDPWGFHSVRPLVEPSLSIMITGRPFEDQVFDHSNFGGKENLQPLSEDVKKDILCLFLTHLDAFKL